MSCAPLVLPTRTIVHVRHIGYTVVNLGIACDVGVTSTEVLGVYMSNVNLWRYKTLGLVFYACVWHCVHEGLVRGCAFGGVGQGTCTII